jgi:hypothetical protein
MLMASLKPSAVSGLPTSIVNAALTIWRAGPARGNRGYWLSRPLSAIRRPMHPSTRRAGGCFLTGGIMTGFVVGLLTGDAMRGVWLGTGLGIIAAVVVWLMDRKRS